MCNFVDVSLATTQMESRLVSLCSCSPCPLHIPVTWARLIAVNDIEHWTHILHMLAHLCNCFLYLHLLAFGGN